MYMDFSALFHNSSKDHSAGGTNRVPADPALWPPAWTTTHYKEYPRFKKISLPDEVPQADFFDLIRGRKSQRDFTKTPVRKSDLGAILRYSCGITGSYENGHARRAQPSGGARFPIEAYPIVFSGSEEVPAGLYHYNVRQHALEEMWQRPFSKKDIGELFIYPWAQDASWALVLTAVFSRTQDKYAERGYRYILLEAGHIGQNVYLSSQALGLKCCALGTLDIALEKLIDIDGITESVVYGLALG
jgi:SagB-type dehydrogenase family enzyme